MKGVKTMMQEPVERRPRGLTLSSIFGPGSERVTSQILNIIFSILFLPISGQSLHQSTRIPNLIKGKWIGFRIQ